MAKLIVVSNRVSLPTRSDSRAGGLEVALRAVFNEFPGVWFGWSGRVVPREAIETRTISGQNPTFVVTDLTAADHDEYYNGFANRVLWPLFHYRPGLTDFNRRYRLGYNRVNELFAGSLGKLLRDDPDLDEQAADALEAMLQAAYDKLRRSPA